MKRRSAWGSLFKLVNCRECDDVFRPILSGGKACACGKSHCSELPAGKIQVSGPCIVLVLNWEDYDGAGPDRGGHWTVLREPHAEVVR